MEDLKLSEQVKMILEKMNEQGYAYGTIKGYETVYRCFLDYAAAHNTDVFSEELGSGFLESVGATSYKRRTGIRSPLGSYVNCANTAIRRLGEFCLFGAYAHRIHFVFLKDWAMDDCLIISEYTKNRGLINEIRGPIDERVKRLRPFYSYLNSVGLRSVRNITPEIISAYLKTEASYSKVHLKHIHKNLRSYFRFLHLKEYLPIDYSGFVPRVCAVENANIPMIWTEDNIEKLLASIDLASPVGKRNYAIFLLISELGIRSCDVVALRGSDIDWDKKTIHFDQEKTGKLNVLPMSDRLGWAIIDYICNARPKVDSPYVFLAVRAPYKKMGKAAVTTALKAQMRVAGITSNAPGARAGVHSLRHSLARKLLENNVPLENIAEIMGHTEVISSSAYLKIDVEGLRGCALSLKGVQDYV